MAFWNSSSNRIALFIALALSLSCVILILLFMLLTRAETNLVQTTLFFIISFAISFAISSLLVRKVLFEKLNIIYKIIRDHKINKKRMGTQVKITGLDIDEVNKEVKAWAQETNEEIDYLNQLEEYRKTFVGNLSHELKTPIFSAQGYLYSLAEGGLHDENINERYIERALANMVRIQEIVEDLEMINSLESGKLELILGRFDLRGLIDEVVRDLQFMAKEYETKLMITNSEMGEHFVEADKEQIRHVLQNLVSNAIKYGNTGGEIRINVYDIEKSYLVEISDDGIGVEEEHLKHLFDRFYRVDSSRSRERGGSGLGLAIVKHIIEAHNQSINVRSTPDVGSTFGFTLKKS